MQSHVDYYLQLIVKTMLLYVKDNKDFTNKLEKVESVPGDCLWITIDVKSLYTNIPNKEGIKAVRETYNNHQLKTVSTKK